MEIYCDVNITKTIIRNLLSNAFKFTPHGGNININALQLDTHYQIEIEDEGVGISQEKLDQIFNTGIYTSTKGINKESGTGIGLSLCIDLANKQGGSIKAKSVPEKGSVFTLFIPKDFPV